MGFAVDGFATDPKPVTISTDKPPFDGHLAADILARCATVEEVIEILSNHNLAVMERFMFMDYDVVFRLGEGGAVEGVGVTGSREGNTMLEINLERVDQGFSEENLAA
jgi:hypothetical protein